MTTTDLPPGADTFVISLPTGWTEVPLVPDELVDSMRARAASDGGDSIEFRRTLVLLRRLAEHAQQGGMVFMATSVEEIRPEDPDAASTEQPYFLTGMVWLMTKRASAFGAERVEFAQLQAAVDPAPTEPGVTRVERPRVMDLTAGPAIRDVTVQRVAGSGVDPAVEVLGCRYHLLIGEGEGMAVLGFHSPNVDLADELLELFHSISMTLEFVPA